MAAGAQRRAKDAAMSAALKAAGNAERKSANCPICHVTYSLRELSNHIAFNCKGRRR